MKILHVAGARPNFMKVAPVLRALESRGTENVLVHTGQHYDPNMSAAFFADLGLPEPDVHLEAGSGRHAVQTARIMERIEPVLLEHRPDLTVVVGDVNSTIAVALVCAKLLLPVAHVEAGLRSFDRTMPEEVNRVLTDQISDVLFTTSPEAEENLAREGLPAERIRFVGNPMIDSLERHLHHARASDVLQRLDLEAGKYVLVTLHRPANVDDAESLRRVLEALAEVARDTTVVFPIHPRTRANVSAHGLDDLLIRVRCVEPIGYIDFLRTMADAAAVLTDSGGIQEETTILGVPCLTFRDNTERPITVEMGTNRLIGTDPAAIAPSVREAITSDRSEPQRPPLWDGKAGERIADEIVAWIRARA